MVEVEVLITLETLPAELIVGMFMHAPLDVLIMASRASKHMNHSLAGAITERQKRLVEAWRSGSRVAANARFSRGHTRLQLFPDGTRLVSAVGGLCDRESNEASVNEAAVYSMDGSVEGVLSGDGWINMYVANVTCMATDGVHIACGYDDSCGEKVRLWTADTLEARGSFAQRQCPKRLALRGNLLVSCTDYFEMCMWNVLTHERIHTLGGSPAPPLLCASALGVSSTVIVVGGSNGSQSGAALIWARKSLGQRPLAECIQFNLQHPRTVCDISVQGDVLATCCGDAVVRIFSVSRGELIRELASTSFMATVDTIALMGIMLVSGEHGGSVKIWALEGDDMGECITTLPSTHTCNVGQVMSVAATPLGSVIAKLESGGAYGLTVWVTKNTEQSEI